MSAGRTPHDGKPYYCRVCGLGFGEYAACEEVDCELEPVETAEIRAHAAKEAATAERRSNVGATNQSQ